MREREVLTGRFVHILGGAAVVVVLALLAPSSPGLAQPPLPSAQVPAQPVVRYSGRVERVDLDAGLVVVSELAGRGKPRRHAFHVAPETPIVSAARLRAWQIRGNRLYEEVPVSLVDLLDGDFVVVDSVADGPRAVALRITIVEAAGSQ
jgi:hypothetical protein